MIHCQSNTHIFKYPHIQILHEGQKNAGTRIAASGVNQTLTVFIYLVIEVNRVRQGTRWKRLGSLKKFLQAICFLPEILPQGFQKEIFLPR